MCSGQLGLESQSISIKYNFISPPQGALYSCLISANVRILILFCSMLLLLFNSVVLNPDPGGPSIW